MFIDPGNIANEEPGVGGAADEDGSGSGRMAGSREVPDRAIAFDIFGGNAQLFLGVARSEVQNLPLDRTSNSPLGKPQIARHCGGELFVCGPDFGVRRQIEETANMVVMEVSHQDRGRDGLELFRESQTGRYRRVSSPDGETGKTFFSGGEAKARVHEYIAVRVMDEPD